MKYCAVLLIGFLSWGVSSAIAADGSMDSLAGTLKAVYLDQGTGQERARITFRLEAARDQSPASYRLSQTGFGRYDRFSDVQWTSESLLEFSDGIFRLKQTRRRIIDKHKTVVRERSFNLIQNRQEIVFRRKDLGEETFREVAFPLKGITVDDVTLCPFLELFIRDMTKGKVKSFYLVTPEPSLYKVNVKYVGPENVRLPIGDFEAIKFRLIADMGILDEVLDRFVPPTFVWFERESFQWLQYQGLESGRKSPPVIVQRTSPLSRQASGQRKSF